LRDGTATATVQRVQSSRPAKTYRAPVTEAEKGPMKSKYMSPNAVLFRSRDCVRCGGRNPFATWHVRHRFATSWEIREASGPRRSPTPVPRARTFDTMPPEAWPRRMWTMISFATEVMTCGEAARCHTFTGQWVPCMSTRSPPSPSGGAEKFSLPVAKVCTSVKTLMGGCREGCHEADVQSGRTRVKDVVSGARCQSL
jgi:hypothetical protein